MKLEENTILEIEQALPPEIPPDIPFEPCEPLEPPMVSIPMIYVDTEEKIEYRIVDYKFSEAKNLETELNALGKKGWWLVQIIPKEKDFWMILVKHGRG